jgi:hypothetical protein
LKKECLVENCRFEPYKNYDKCILHCEKDHRFDKNEFWQKIREFINKQKSEILFYEIIFPKFEQINTSKIIRKMRKDDTPICKITENNLHFWEADTVRIFDKPVTFMNCTFLGKADFSHIIFKNAVNIRNSNFTDNIRINESQFKNQLYFSENTKINELRIDYSTKINKLKLEDITLSNDLFIKSPEIIKLEIINNKKINKIRIHDSEINSILIKSNIFINEFMLKNTTIKGNVNISENNKNIIDNFEINGCTFNDDSFIDIKNMNFNNLSIIDNDNISDAFCLHDTKIEKKIRFEYTNISNFEFHNCNFESEKINIGNVSFISNNGFTIFNGVKWGDIRKTFDKTSAEMEAYKKEITAKGSKAPCREKIIFWMNYMVSDFGRSWVQPLLWYLVLGLFFSFLYLGNLLQNIPALCLITGTIVGFYGLMKFRMKVTKSLLIALVPSFFYYFSEAFVKKEYWDLRFNQLLRFINPFDTIKDTNTGSLMLWIVFRLFAVFIIYQFIISLRRQTRR